ncbi:MAG: class I SAM-dependent methyltransferase [Nitrosotalea sp.]
MSIPLLLDDLPSYLSIRAKLGGELMLNAKNIEIRTFLKENLRKIKNPQSDTTKLEKKWVAIYKRNLNSKFYTHVKNAIQKIPKCKHVLEHGCSIGNLSNKLAKRSNTAFGIDQSFYAILEAKQKNFKNSDFVVADSLNPPFGNKKFDMVIALNLLDIIEPLKLLKVILSQTKRFVVISDPYDFERGKDSVKTRIDARGIRLNLVQNGFRLIQNTKQPSFIPWKLNVNNRLNLNYKVDVIVAKNVR